MESEHSAQFAWEPLTPRGVAAFAGASWKRLCVVQLIVAVLAAAVVVWFLQTDWFPVMRAAIRQLPANGVVRSGRLDWTGDSPAKLAENQFLALSVDLRHEGTARSLAHVQVEFGQADLVALSLFGALPIHYPRSYVVAFNRDELQPWWGAWSPFILALAAGGVILGLMLSWAILALVYAPAAWLVGFFSDRDLGLAASGRLCGAALMPGALWMVAAVTLYGLGALDLVKLIIAAAFHILIGWVYVIAAPFWRPRARGAVPPTGNPFTGAPPGQSR